MFCYQFIDKTLTLPHLHSSAVLSLGRTTALHARTQTKSEQKRSQRQNNINTRPI